MSGAVFVKANLSRQLQHATDNRWSSLSGLEAGNLDALGIHRDQSFIFVMTSFGAGLGGSFWLGLVAIALFMMLTISMALVIAVGLGSLLPMMFLISMACGLTMTMLLGLGGLSAGFGGVGVA
ncbi:hypothetical protein GY15_31410 [Delftia sp. 670]|nr:hypothetical protein GY15_31410 [Delftia sp. 670]